MRKVCLLIAGLLSAFVARAQMDYDFSYSTGAAYKPLTSEEVIPGHIWSNYEYSTRYDIFPYRLGPDSMETFNVALNTFVPVSKDADGIRDGLVNTFVPLGMLIVDKGWPGGVSHISTSRFEVTGSEPFRVIKLEYNNAAIRDEIELYHTTDDSLSYQLWIYESSNVIEFHYGPSYLSHLEDYHDSYGLAIAYYKGARIYDKPVGFDYAHKYFLKGDPAAPVLDSTSDPVTPVMGLSGHPAQGMVYRFTPKSGSLGIAEQAPPIPFRVYPNVASSVLNIDNPGISTAIYEIIATSGCTAGHSGTVLCGNNQIDVSGLAAGAYLLRLYTAQGVVHERFIKQ
jgi:hypothetical protein